MVRSVSHLDQVLVPACVLRPRAGTVANDHTLDPRGDPRVPRLGDGGKYRRGRRVLEQLGPAASRGRESQDGERERSVKSGGQGASSTWWNLPTQPHGPGRL
jgi:hypothetical protein